MLNIHTLDEHLVQQLPLPLAQLCLRARNAKTAMEYHQSAYYLWEAALKLLGSIAVVEYADHSNQDPDLAEMLRKLARPLLGHWWEFVRRLVPVFAERGDAGFVLVRDLLLGRVRDDMPRAAGLDAALIKALEGHSGARSTVRLTELFDRLVAYRNREIGHGAAGMRDDEVYAAMAPVLLAGVGQVLGRLDILAGRRLLYIGDVRRQATGNWLVERYTLIGESAKRIESLEIPESEISRLPRPERVYIEVPANPGESKARPGLRALHPLVHFDATSGKVYFLNSRRGNRDIEYLCYWSGDTLRREDQGAEHRELLARVLRQPVGTEAAEKWATVSQAEEPARVGPPVEDVGRRIGEFELLSRLGQGGMGVVYRAWQPSLGRQVALKCMLRVGDPKAEARFAREIRALGRVEHPNIVKVFTSGTEGDQWFYAMELIEGAELSRVCDQLVGSSAAEIDEGHWRRALSTACERARSQETQLSGSHHGLAKPAAATALAAPMRSLVPVGGRGYVMQVVEIVRQMAGAAHTLHEVGVIHRDIKPGNIMLTADARHPVLMDLGLAQLADETEGRLTSTRQFVGTLRYASPEQVLSAGHVDRRTDVYSLGATLWELLTLCPMFGVGENTPTPELMLRIQTTDPESPCKYNRHVPRDLEAIVLKCLEKDRDRRYATAAELAADLGRYQAGEPVSAQPPSLTYLTGKFVRRNRLPLAVAALVVALLLGGAVAAFIGIDRERRAALNANDRLQEQLYSNLIAVAERELTLNQDVGLASDLLEQCPAHLRGWEWRYLMRLRDGPRSPLRGHKGGLWMGVYSPDGRSIATASIDGTVNVWDVDSGRLLRTFDGHTNWFTRVRVPVMCLAFSPDGRHIASGSLDPNLLALRRSSGEVKIWEVATGRVVHTFNKQMGLITSLAFSPDGERIASSSINEHNSFAVWHSRTGQMLHTVLGHTGHVHRLRYSPDGRLLASSSTDGSVKLWDATTLQPVRSIVAHPAPVFDIAFAPDGARLASAGLDSTVRVWETATGASLLTLRGHTGSAVGVAFGPDGRLLASVGFDKTLRLWDSLTGQEKITLRGHKEVVFGVAFSPDGNQLLSSSFDRTAQIWDASPAQEPVGAGLFTLAGHADRVNSVAFSPKGNRLASGGWDSTARLWDGRTGAPLHTLEGHRGAVWGLAFSPDGNRVATASWDCTVKIWNAESGREVLTFTEHTTPVHSVAFSPDGKRLVSCSWDGLVKIWDASTGKEIATCDRHIFPAMAVAFSPPDGKQIVSGSGDSTAIVWDATSGKVRFAFHGHTAAIHGLSYSPDGKRIASASWDKTVKVWDASTGKELLTFRGHSDLVKGVAYSPDGTRIASASEDKTVRIWDAATGREVVPPRYHRGVVWSVSFSPDGKRVAAGSWSPGGWVKTWNTE